MSLKICEPISAVLDKIGNTPLLRLPKIAQQLGEVDLFAKAEWLNPGGSVKDRAALNMILEGEQSGALRDGKIILEATSGNMGIALAMIGTAKGYRVKLCVPENVSDHCKRVLRAYGAEIIYTSALESSDGAIQAAREIYARDPERYFYPDQYNNPANWDAHYHTTATEIFEQTEGQITHFVAGLGTSGTFMGTGRRLRELNPDIQLISFEPDSPFHGLEGLKHMESAITPGIYDKKLADQNLEVSTEDAHKMVRRLAREEGLLVGISSGAALHAALQIAEQIERGVVVTILPDSAARYLSDPFWEEN